MRAARSTSALLSYGRWPCCPRRFYGLGHHSRPLLLTRPSPHALKFCTKKRHDDLPFAPERVRYKRVKELVVRWKASGGLEARHHAACADEFEPLRRLRSVGRVSVAHRYRV